MANMKLSRDQLDALDFQADQSYKAFRRAVERMCCEDAAWSENLFSGYSDTLVIVTHRHDFLKIDRQTKIAGALEKHLLQYALGHMPSITLKNILYTKQFGDGIEPKETNDSAEMVVQAVNNKKIPYSRIEILTMHVADAHDFQGIVRALDYARDKHHS